MGNLSSIIWPTEGAKDQQEGMALLVSFALVALLGLVMFASAISRVFPHHLYMKLFWFEDHLNFYFTRKTFLGDQSLAVYYVRLSDESSRRRRRQVQASVRRHHLALVSFRLHWA